MIENFNCGMDNKAGVLMQRYELGRLLGQGTFAKVYNARSLLTGLSVAIKVIDKEKVLRVGLIDQIKREISIMRMVKHPNIVQLYEVMATKTKIYFVLEYAKGGEFFNKIVKGKLEEDVARKYFQQLITAVYFCHCRGFYHRDLKPENLLLDEDENLKISDFGLSAPAESKRQDGLLHTTCGTPAYVAPEVINKRGYDGAKADIWSCGVILFVLLAGCLPFHDPNLMEMYRKIGRAEFKCPSWFPNEVKRLLFRMLDPNPRSRISITKIRENPWFKKGSSSKLINVGTESSEMSSLDASSDSCGTSSKAAEEKQEQMRLASINAFDIISFSAGFDLSGLFEEPCQKEARFTSLKPAAVIISRREETAKYLKLKVRKRDAGLLRFEGLKEGRKGILSIDVEIFEVPTFFHIVELKQSNGDTLEYQKILKEGIRPGLQDIVWGWQSEQQPEQVADGQAEQKQQLQEQALHHQQEILQPNVQKQLLVQERLP